jgi:4-alpha-glucanotransferase
MLPEFSQKAFNFIWQADRSGFAIMQIQYINDIAIMNKSEKIFWQ